MSIDTMSSIEKHNNIKEVEWCPEAEWAECRKKTTKSMALATDLRGLCITEVLQSRGSS
ncbi:MULTISPECIES: hypothetical protein [unclassified Mesorhizobium]|uniref:hypothetical protein n=2 Tax=unclassified Mesorhizobium TaxID=325217 RepID=UPI0013E3D1B2|nr:MULTISPECIES: hypothetical protein [unclassified Mesorhizobium]